MIGKKDNHDIFKQYRTILLEQNQDGGVSDILNKINSSSLDSKSKELLNNLFKNDKVVNIFSTMAMQQPVGDADTAEYSSYPEAGPAIDQDDQDTANEPDPEFAKEIAKAKKEQQEKYPEKE